MAKLFTTGESSMGYIHCCGALHKTRTFYLSPQDKFMLCELDYLSKCPVCGHTVVQLTRISDNNEISVIRRTNKKAKEFLCENFIDDILSIDKKMLLINPKAILQEYTQGLDKKLPQYIIKNETGKAHNKTFYVDVVYNNKIIGQGAAKSIKKAEKEAAMQPTWLRELKRTMLAPERFLAAVREKGEMLKHIPEPLRTEELCLAAVQQDGRMLAYVPETLKTETLCLAAVKQNREAMQHVPPALRDTIGKDLKS